MQIRERLEHGCAFGLLREHLGEAVHLRVAVVVGFGNSARVPALALDSIRHVSLVGTGKHLHGGGPILRVAYVFGVQRKVGIYLLKPLHDPHALHRVFLRAELKFQFQRLGRHAGVLAINGPENMHEGFARGTGGDGLVPDLRVPHALCLRK